MRLSELSGKEIVHIVDGKRLGVLGQTDLVFDEKTGEIQALLIPEGPAFSIRKQKKEITIYWKQIKTVGRDIILVDDNDKIR